MILNVNDNFWVKPLLFVVGLLLVIGLWASLAGGIFLVSQDSNFNDATPLTVYQYWYYYRTDPAIMRWLYIASGISLACIVFPITLFFAPAKKSLFGDAKFATRRQIKASGLFATKGIIVGQYRNQYLMFGGSQHVIMSAPTRSGKGVGIVVPNLLTLRDSVVVLDIKQENYQITSKFRRKHGQSVYLFNPAAADYRSHRYNPLSYISEDPNFRIDDVQKIANMLFPDMQGTDPIWTATPRALFLGVVLYLIETPGKLVTLGQVLRESLQDGDGSKHFAKIINDRHAAKNPLSGACIRALNTYISIESNNTRAGIISSFRSRLELWSNPLIDAATSGNDFDLRDVRKKPMSIYIGVTPDNLERVAPLLNLFFQQLIDLNTRQLPEHNPDLKYQCVILPDEFTAMGKVAAISKGISYLAGYGLRMLPIIQSPAQLVDVYGKEAARNFRENHALQIVFPPKASDIEVAKDISEWLGYQTVKGVSESKRKGWFVKKAPSENQSDQRRALMLPQEITGLGKKNELVIVEDCPPILAKKIRYYNDPVFIDRLKAVSPSLAALGKKLPSEQQLKQAALLGEMAAPVPSIDIEAHNQLVGGNVPTTVTVPSSGGTRSIETERPITPADMPKLDTLALVNFVVDFSKVEAPPAGSLDETALLAYADNLCREAGINV